MRILFTFYDTLLTTTRDYGVYNTHAFDTNQLCFVRKDHCGQSPLHFNDMAQGPMILLTNLCPFEHVVTLSIPSLCKPRLALQSLRQTVMHVKPHGKFPKTFHRFENL